jgi:hypothetical protein
MKKIMREFPAGALCGAAYGIYTIILYRSLGIICSFSPTWELTGSGYNPLCALEGLITLHLQAAQSFIFWIGVLVGKYVTTSELMMSLLINVLYALVFIATAAGFAALGGLLERLLRHGPHPNAAPLPKGKLFFPDDLSRTPPQTLSESQSSSVGSQDKRSSK